MIISSNLPDRPPYDDYDFMIESGVLWTLSINKGEGDTITYEGNTVQFHVVEKPSLSDPEATTPEENITVFMDHVVSLRHTTRAAPLATPEQKHEWQRTMEDITKAHVH